MTDSSQCASPFHAAKRFVPVYRLLHCVLITVFACGDTDADTASDPFDPGGVVSAQISEETIVDFCHNQCNYNERCEPNNFLLTTLACSDDVKAKIEAVCSDNSSRLVPYLRKDVLEAYLDCRSEGCLDTPNEQTCLNRAIKEANIPQSAIEHASICEETSRRCSDSNIDLDIGDDGCGFSYVMGTTKMVEILDRCLAKPCDEINACLTLPDDGVITLFFD